MKTIRSANPVNPLIGRIGVQTIFTAALALALALTLSCSGDDGGGGGGGGSSDLPHNSTLDFCGRFEDDHSMPPIAPPYCNEGETVTIGTQIWQKCNLKVVPSKGSHGCYCNKPENCEKYGRLYDWEAAMSACPSGFRLPTYEEWEILVNYAGDSVSGKKLKATNGWREDVVLNGPNIPGNGTDEFGFAALPGGAYITSLDGAFSAAGGEGQWWTATEFDSSKAYAPRMMDSENRVLMGYNYYKGSVFNSVRCIGGPPPKDVDEDGKCILNSETVKIGEQVWMTENLKCNVSGSKCSSNCRKSGRLYNWEMAKTICPSGWHLPSKEEWNVLQTYIESDKGCTGCAAKHLKAQSGWEDWKISNEESFSGNGLDSYGFSAIPINGEYYYPHNGSVGWWWSATETNGSYGPAIYAHYLTMRNSYDSIPWMSYNNKSNYFYSVRCIQD